MSYNPSYIIDQDPKRFGGQQEDYLATARSMIQSTSRKIVACRESKGDPKALFFEIIRDLSAARANLAKAHQTKEWEVFGKRRDAYYPGRISALTLEGVYEAHGRKLISFFATHLRTMEVAAGKFQKQTLFLHDQFNGIKCRLYIEVLTTQDVAAKNYFRDSNMFLPESISHQALIVLNDKPFSAFESVEAQAEFAEYRQKLFAFKKASPENYRTRRMANAFYYQSDKCPSPANLGIPPEQVREKYAKESADTILGNMKSIHVHAILRFEMKGKMYALTDYLTWMYENHEWLQYQAASQHPIERMKICSKVTLAHQDEYLIQQTLEEISEIFARVVMWQPAHENLDALKAEMTVFCYLATHNIRDVRGTAAENEWLEAAIYDSFPNIDCTIDQLVMMDLEAFSAPLLSGFAISYGKRVQLRMKA